MDMDDLFKQFKDADPLLPAKKVAPMLGMKEQTLNVWRWLQRSGQPAPALPFVKIGRRAIRYRKSDVLKFIEENRHALPGNDSPAKK